MNTIFRSALSRIKADEELISKTEQYLNAALIQRSPNPGALVARSRWSSIKTLVAAACMLFMLIGGGAGGYNYYQTPASYLSVDINPSVELGINPFGRVVSAEGYNADGLSILKDLDVIGLPVDEAVSALILSASQKGFIAGDGSTVISLTSTTDNSQLAAQIEAQAEAGTQQAITANGQNAQVISDQVALNLHEQAQSIGITPGKLNLIQKLQAVDPAATIEKYRDASVKDIMRDTKAARNKNKTDGEEQNTGNDSILNSENPDNGINSPGNNGTDHKPNQDNNNSPNHSNIDNQNNTNDSVENNNDQVENNGNDSGPSYGNDNSQNNSSNSSQNHGNDHNQNHGNSNNQAHGNSNSANHGND